MRKFAAGLGLCALLVIPHWAAAQSPAGQIETARNNRYRNIRRPMTPAEQAIHHRAAVRAAQREARLEARKWTGHSALRPVVVNEYMPPDVNRYLMLPYGGYYGVPFGW